MLKNEDLPPQLRGLARLSTKFPLPLSNGYEITYMNTDCAYCDTPVPAEDVPCMVQADEHGITVIGALACDACSTLGCFHVHITPSDHGADIRNVELGDDLQRTFEHLIGLRRVQH